MPIDDPTFPNEEEIPLNAPTAILTSSGCINPGNAVDNDPTTSAAFKPVGSGSGAYGTPPNLNGAGNGVSAVYSASTTGYDGPFTQFLSQTENNVNDAYYCSMPPGSPTGLANPTATAGGDINCDWTGWIIPIYSETYTFTLDPGNVNNYCPFLNNQGTASLVLGGSSVIVGNVGFNQSGGVTGTITLQAGVAYAVRVNRQDYTNFVCALEWQSTHQAKQVVPQGQLFTPLPVPVILKFTGAYNGNGTATLTWDTAYASVAIDQGVGSVAASGSITVTCTTQTTFTLSATGVTYVDSSGNSHTQFTSQSVTITPPRYLRVDWGFDALIGRIRFKQEMPGGGPSNTGIDFESSLGYLEGARPPPDVPFNTYIPLPLDAVIHELTLDPPFFARGIVVFPDAFAGSPNSYPEVDLYQLQVYQSVLGANTMPQTGPNPTIPWSTVGVQEIDIYPYVSGSAYSTLPAASLCSLFGLQGFGVTSTSKLAVVTGGETVEDIDGYETGRETKLKITNELADMRYFYLVFGGQLTVDAKNANGPEVQYWVEQLTDRAPYLTIVAKGMNGNPNKTLVFPKCKIDGAFNFDMQKDKVTDIDMELRVFRDTTWIRQDGPIGATREWIFADNATPALHS